MAEQQATWVYAVVPATAAGRVPDLPAGVAGEPVRLIGHGDIAAVVGSVSRDEVEEAALLRHLRDPEWLERAARRHHRVVSALAGAGPAVPFRLAIVYHADGGVRRFLEGNRDGLLDALATVSNRAEWGVQAYAATAPASLPEDPLAGQPAGPGTAYLLRQRAARAARERERRRIGEAVYRIEASLAPFAVASQVQPRSGAGPQSPTGSMVMNVSYLVDDARRDEFVAAARRLDGVAPGVWLRVTGPWPGYSFVEIGDGRG